MTIEALFVRYREAGDAEALGTVFDRTAPQLVLVAAHLAGSSAAEDIVQATFLDAIRLRDRFDAARPLVPWLVGILSNHVRQARRQRQRAPEPERLVAGGMAVAAGDEAAANEAIAAVHTAVAALPLHYRQALSLRLVHGLEFQQIALSLEVPLGTVKARVHRGLVLLRRALPAGLATAVAAVLSPGRGLPAMRGIVVSSATASASVAGAGVAGAGILIGGLVVKQWVVGICMGMFLVAAWWTIGAGFGTGNEVASRPGDPATVRGRAADLPAGTNPAATPPDVDPIGPAGDPQRVEVASTGRLGVKAVWSGDHGAAGAIEVALAADEPGGQSPSAKTDADGNCTFDALAPGAYRVAIASVRAQGEASAIVRAGTDTSCEIVVRGDIRLRIEVVGERGEPQPGASVWANDHRREGERCVLLGTCDRAGTLLYHGLAIDEVWARLATRQPSARRTFDHQLIESLPRDVVDVRLVLGPPACAVLGSVVTPDGLPIADARVAIACDDTAAGASERVELVLRTDAQGAFRCDEVPAGERYVVADHAGFASAIERVTTTAGQATPIVLRLRRGAALSGRIVDAAGNGLGGVQVWTSLGRNLTGMSMWSDGWRSTRTDPDGHYRLDAIVPGESQVRAELQPRQHREFVFADGGHEVWDVTAEPVRSLRGTVTDEEGRPLTGWELEAQIADRRQGLRQYFARTDEAGRFEVEGLEDAEHRLFVFAPRAGHALGAAAHVPRAVVDHVRASAEELAIRIDRGGRASGWIEGSVAMPDGLQSAAALSLYAGVLRGGGFTVPQERLEPGRTRFRIGPLPAGDYDLLCDVEGRGRMEQRGLHLLPDETLQLPAFAADSQRSIDLVLRHADGSPARGATVTLKPSWLRCTETDPGHYRSPPLSPGALEVAARGPDFAPCTFAIDAQGATTAFEHAVSAGTTVEVVLHPATPRERWIGAVNVRLRDAAGAEIVRDFVQIDGKQDFTWRIGLTPGPYSVAVEGPFEGKAEAAFTVGSDALRVELQLAK